MLRDEIEEGVDGMLAAVPGDLSKAPADQARLRRRDDPRLAEVSVVGPAAEDARPLPKKAPAVGRIAEQRCALVRVHAVERLRPGNSSKIGTSSSSTQSSKGVGRD